MKTGLVAVMIMVAASLLMAQSDLQKQLRSYTPPDEMVTLSANIPFDKAIQLISEISEKKTGRKVISLVRRDTPIGVEIINVQYDKALLMIVQYAGLIYEKKETVTVIRSKVDVVTDVKPETYADINSREVKISALFFEMDVSKARERGINWQFLLSNKAGGVTSGMTTTGAAATGTSTSSAADFSVSANSQFGLGSFFGEALGLFRYFESENLGEMIASPTVTVRNRVQGRVQVGSDYSEKIRDFSGNIINSFFPTGTIIKVTPYIYQQDEQEYCVLDIEVEKSTANITDLFTEIKKTSAKTQVMMVDGEQTAIGGLFVNEETTSRSGIPILKDLPWWVLGLRYITGNDKVTVTKKELVIVIKIDMLPHIKDRLAFPATGNPLENARKAGSDQLKIYQFESQKTENELHPASPGK